MIEAFRAKCAAMTLATQDVSFLPAGMCRTRFGAVGVPACGPSQARDEELRWGSVADIAMNGIVPPSPMLIAGLPKNGVRPPPSRRRARGRWRGRPTRGRGRALEDDLARYGGSSRGRL